MSDQQGFKLIGRNPNANFGLGSSMQMKISAEQVQNRINDASTKHMQLPQEMDYKQRSQAENESVNTLQGFDKRSLDKPPIVPGKII